MTISVIPAESFNVNVAPVGIADRFFRFGPLAPGCVVRLVVVVVHATIQARCNWGFAFGPSEGGDADAYRAGFLPMQGNGDGLGLADRDSYAANLPPNARDLFVHYFGLRVGGAGWWFMIGVSSDDANAVFFHAAVEVVGVLGPAGSQPGRVVNVG